MTARATKAAGADSEVEADTNADPIVAVPDDVAATGQRFRCVRSTGITVPVLTDGEFERKFVGDGQFVPAGVDADQLNNLAALGYILPA